MSQHRKNKNLTLVLTCSLILFCALTSSAAPDSTISPKEIDPVQGLKSPPQPMNNPATTQETAQETLQLTPVPPPSENLQADPILPTRRLAKQSMATGVNFWMGSVSQLNEQQSLIGYTFSFNKYNYPYIGNEWAIHFIPTGLLGVHYGVKWIQDLSRWNEPFVKVSAGGLFSAHESFATFINWKRYQLKAAVGFDDFLNYGRRFRLESGIIFSGFGMAYSIEGHFAF